MARTTTKCPRCRQPVAADVEQLFDLNADPKAKQRFLSGNFNLVHCQNCGYEGSLATPLVYHDADKELLLTYFPPELGMPVNEQEKMIGPMINQVLNRLPPEKRKAYLLRPQTMLTQQQMIERVLESDGITKDMLQAQQQRLNLLQRLFSTAPEGRAEIIAQEESLIDESFFSMLSRLIETSMAQGDQQSGRALAELQKELLSKTKVGQTLAAQAAEAEEAVKELQEASKKGLTRESLLDMIVNASSEIRLTTLVSMARSGLDYNFFQILSERIDAAEGDEKEKLTELREKLLEMVQEIDQAMQKQTAQARQVLESLLKAKDIPAAIQENSDLINEVFIDALRSELQAATQKNDTDRLNKLQQVVETIQKMSMPQADIALVQELIGATSDEDRQKILEEHADQVTPELLQMMSGLATQTEGQDQSAEMQKSFQDAYMAALRFSMEANLKK
jgi:hypothetical protein